MRAWLERRFGVSRSGSTLQREALGGLTTFMTMSYIVFVQPALFSSVGMDFDAVLAATCLITAFSTLLMAFLANYPIAVAPAMGHDFFFVFTVVGAMGYTWQQALGAVFLSGVLFLVMSIWGIREALIRAIPASLKHGIAVGIGLLITLVGLEWGGFVAGDPGTLITLGDLGTAPVWMSGAPVIFVFFFLDLFDSIGSLIGIAEQGNFMKGGDLPRAREALMADAIGTTGARLIGNSPVVSYIESATGVAEGARTGLANLVTAGMFIVALFFAPLARMVGAGHATESGFTLYPTVAPALIVVGAFMMRNVIHIEWDRPAEYIPAFITITVIPFTFSITDGIAFGFISYVALSLVSGGFRKLHWLIWVFTLMFLIRYVVVG